MCRRLHPDVLEAASLFVQVRHELHAMGVVVLSADAAGAPPPVACVAVAAPLLPPAHAALLDVSALLALISDATHLPPTDARLVRWASTNEHWRRSLEEEAELPLLPRLASALAAHPRWLCMAEDAAKLQQLLACCGGRAEAARWASLRPRLELQPAEQPAAAVTKGRYTGAVTTCVAASSTSVLVCVDGADADADAAPLPLCLKQLSARLVATRPEMSVAHRRLVLAAAATDALLVTANRGLLRRLEQARVWLRTHPHEARWLAAADDKANDDSDEAVAATDEFY
jgi:hypothetical protein